MALNVKKLVAHARLPERATPGSIGYDLYSSDGYVVLPGQRVVVSTGIQVSIPEGTYARIAPRSGLAVKHGIDVGGGVIDPDYTSEIKVILFNHDPKQSFVIRPGYRIAQLILEHASTPEVVEVDEIFVDSERGAGGFGSTGN